MVRRLEVGGIIGEWISDASSADGARLVAVADNGPIYTSTDSGVTWTSNAVPALFWSSVASSADGCKLIAVPGSWNGVGPIYISQATSTPVLSLSSSGSGVALSWLIPSEPFVLQENADLTTTNWTDVPITPLLNSTNLQNEVVLPLAAGSRFYRLKASVN